MQQRIHLCCCSYCCYTISTDSISYGSMDENKHKVQQQIIRASNTCNAYFSPLMATDVLCGLGSGAENCVRNRAKLLGNLGTEISFSRSASSLKSPASIFNSLPPWNCVSSMRSERRQRITNKNGNWYIQVVKSRRRVRWKNIQIIWHTEVTKQNLWFCQRGVKSDCFFG